MLLSTPSTLCQHVTGFKIHDDILRVHSERNLHIFYLENLQNYCEDLKLKNHNNLVGLTLFTELP